MTPDFVPLHGAEVIVTLKDGTRFSNYNEVDLGRGLSNPLTADELWEKFEDCALRSLEKSAIRPLFDSLQCLENATNLRDITELMLHPAKPGQSVAAE
jgi:hypothetical protein